jgi:hypothetical protein
MIHVFTGEGAHEISQKIIKNGSSFKITSGVQSLLSFVYVVNSKYIYKSTYNLDYFSGRRVRIANQNTFDK